MEAIDYTELENRIAYVFRDKGLIDEALRHSSFVNEQNDTSLKDNERLEFLGDAVVNLAVGHLLMECFPDHREGDLSRMRANLVNESRLARIARSVELGAFIRLGKGEMLTHGREKNSILANSYEAVVAAIFQDGGFDAAFTMIRRHFLPLIESMRVSEANRDYKSKLQELTQLTHGAVPQYDVVQESGPDHDKTFRVRLKMGALFTEGTGKSKKTAEQEAARKAMSLLEPE